MKLKAVLFENTSRPLVKALEEIRLDVMAEVLIPHLKVPADFGPAEFYIQRCDAVIKDSQYPTSDWMCEARLTGVSGPLINFNRSVKDFWNAGKALTALYRRKIIEHLPVNQRMQLFVVIMIDEPVPLESGKHSPLIESEPEWVKGAFHEDFPLCPTCGHTTVRIGATYKCLNCGESLGAS